MLSSIKDPTGTKVRITPPAGANTKYPGFCKAFAGVVGTFIRHTHFSSLYPGEFAIIGLGKPTVAGPGKSYEQFLTVDKNWLTAAS